MPRPFGGQAIETGDLDPVGCYAREVEHDPAQGAIIADCNRRSHADLAIGKVTDGGSAGRPGEGAVEVKGDVEVNAIEVYVPVL